MMMKIAPWSLGTFLLGAVISSYSSRSPQLWTGALIIFSFIFIFSLIKKKLDSRSQSGLSISNSTDSISTAYEAMETASTHPEEMLEVVGVESFEASTVAPEIVAMPLGASMDRFSKSDWEYLIRNAQDGGTNSILASHVLKKTAQILEGGNKEALEMKVQSEEVFSSAQEMLHFVGEIRSIARSAKVVAFNLMVEAGRHDSSSGGAIMVVAKEMATLSENINKLTGRMETSVTSVSQVASNNQKKCATVSGLFTQIDAELNQFKFLMARIEDLSISQCEKIRSFEARL